MPCFLATTRRADGRQQVVYAGRPLHYYVGDKKPGQVLALRGTSSSSVACGSCKQQSDGPSSSRTGRELLEGGRSSFAPGSHGRSPLSGHAAGAAR